MSEATPVDCPTVILATDKQTLHNFSERAWGRSLAINALRFATPCVIRNLINGYCIRSRIYRVVLYLYNPPLFKYLAVIAPILKLLLSPSFFDWSILLLFFCNDKYGST